MALSKPIHAERGLPPVDERLVEPETPYEMYDGELVAVSPADPPHAIQHTKIGALVELHARSRFWVATEMLTRTSRTSDIAPDVSVFPRAPDPRTGGRQLEHLTFEVVSTQSLRDAGGKAARLIARGVRRVFAIDVKRGRVLEWSRSRSTWRPLALRGHIDDPVFATPLPIEPLAIAATIDDAVQRALIKKKNPVLEAERARCRAAGERTGRRKGLLEGKRKGLLEGKRKGLLEGKRAALLGVLAARGIASSSADRARIAGEADPRRLDRWIIRAARCASIVGVFAEA